MKLKLKQPDKSSACYLNGNTDTDDPALCDISIPVWTRFGLEQTGSTRCDRLPSGMTINGLPFQDSYYMLFMLQQANNMSEEMSRTKIHIQKTELIGQQLFDTYNVPPIEVCKKSNIYLVSNYSGYNKAWSYSNLDKNQFCKIAKGLACRKVHGAQINYFCLPLASPEDDSIGKLFANIIQIRHK